MSKREKLFQRLKNNPKNATFAQIEKLLLQENFILDRIVGSHHIFKSGSITFVIPVHKNKVKSIYVKRVTELIEKENDKEEE